MNTIPAGTELIKLNERTARKGCRSCGRSGLYYFHAPDVGNVQVERTDASAALAKGDRAPVERLTLHRLPDGSCRPATGGAYGTGSEEQRAQTGALIEESRGSSFTADTGTQESAAKAAQSVADSLTVLSAGTDTPGSTQAALNAFQTLINAMAPQVDVSQVQTMITAALSDLDSKIAKAVDGIARPQTVITELINGAQHTVTDAHKDLPTLVNLLLAGLNVMMVGPAGGGKSTIARHAADALGVEFYSIPLCPVSTKAELFGYMQATGDYVRTPFREAYEHGGVFLFDEIDAAHPGVLCAGNDAIASADATFPDGRVKKHDQFFAVAAANTFGRGADRTYVGRTALDAATLDRFAVLEVGYDESLEEVACVNTGCDTAEVKRVLKFVRDRRRSAERQNMRVVISPRASIGMSRAVRVGVPFDQAAEIMLFKGMSAQDRSKLSAGI